MKLYNVVRKLLETEPIMRSSDKYLLWAVWQKTGYASLLMSRDQFMSKNCPTPESVTRCRRQLQQTYPHLKATRKVEQERRKIAAQKGTHVFRTVVTEEKPIQQKLEWVFTKDGMAYQKEVK